MNLGQLYDMLKREPVKDARLMYGISLPHSISMGAGEQGVRFALRPHVSVNEMIDAVKTAMDSNYPHSNGYDRWRPSIMTKVFVYDHASGSGSIEEIGPILYRYIVGRLVS